MTATRLPEVNFRETFAQIDPYPALAELRRTTPLAKATDTPLTWVVTRHADVAALLRDPRLGHHFPREYMEYRNGPGPSADFAFNALTNRDPPDHTRLRALMGKAFRGIVVRKRRDDVLRLVDELLDAALERGTFDVVGDLAEPLTLRVICDLIGIGHVDRDAVNARVRDLFGDDSRAIHGATQWLRDYIGALVDDCDPDPDGDLVQRMLAAEDGEDALTHDEVVDNALLMFFGGFGTVSALVANGCALLLSHPDERHRLAKDPSLAATAVEEFVRYESPATVASRLTLEPLEIAGHVIKPMRVLFLLIASANRDETVFDRAERLDVARSPNPHVGFGGGIHHCLGAMLARLEAEVLFARMGERIAIFEPDGDPERMPEFGRAYTRIPARVTPA